LEDQPATSCDLVLGLSSQSSVYAGGDLRNFISNEDYVSEEHNRQLRSGVLPYFFTKYEFTASEQE